MFESRGAARRFELFLRLLVVSTGRICIDAGDLYRALWQLLRQFLRRLILILDTL